MTDQSEEPDHGFDFEGVFGEHYLHFYNPDLTPERNAHETSVIWRLLALQTGQSVLDLGCGHGRIAIELARRGARVTGLDASAMFLDLARQEAAAAGLPITYVEGDMRRLRWQDEFDAILLWYTTFGYFSDGDNEEVLRQAERALKPGGRLLIEQVHRNALLRQGLPQSHVSQRGDDLMIDLANYDAVNECVRTERVTVKDGRVQRTNFTVRLYGFAELARLLRSVGFRSVEGFGQDGEPLTVYSRRLLVLASK